MSELFSVQGKVAIVTGASAGLGRRFAQVLADNGAQVVAAARRLDKLEDLAASHPLIVSQQCDVVNEEDRSELIRSTVDRFGTVDILVNNAGAGVSYPATEEPLESWHRTIELNLTSVFDLSRLVARHLIEEGRPGSIINIASILGLVAAYPIPNASYAATKAAVINLTRELGCQWAKDNVRVNAIAPGYFPSEFMGEQEGEAKTVAFLERSTPMGRMGKSGELDGALLFLASQASSYCTGTTLVVDGGWTAR
jgi:NAD(P)-dependent dehydrogenase (short-subunit alcohol dehydrogenase family)